jgi:hypothetical protein
MLIIWFLQGPSDDGDEKSGSEGKEESAPKVESVGKEDAAPSEDESEEEEDAEEEEEEEEMVDPKEKFEEGKFAQDLIWTNDAAGNSWKRDSSGCGCYHM